MQGVWAAVPIGAKLTFVMATLLPVRCPPTAANINTFNSMRIAAGGPLLGSALILSFVGCILASVAGCQMRGLPGVGEDAGSCCSVAPQAAPAAPAPQLVAYAQQPQQQFTYVQQPQQQVVYVPAGASYPVAGGAPPQTA
jgi:hypothetical protein